MMKECLCPVYIEPGKCRLVTRTVDAGEGELDERQVYGKCIHDCGKYESCPRVSNSSHLEAIQI